MMSRNRRSKVREARHFAGVYLFIEDCLYCHLNRRSLLFNILLDLSCTSPIEENTMEQQSNIKIIIIGDATGGMAAALRARRLNEKASIILIERDNRVNYANSGAPSLVGGVLETDTFLIHQSPEGLRDRYNLDVRSGTELVSLLREQHSVIVKPVTGGDSYHLKYDKLILAQGAYHCLLRAEGVDRANVFSFRTMLDLQRIRDYISVNRCRTAAILGGGYLAFKALECLYNFGLRISIIHAQSRVCEGFDNDIANCLQQELRREKGIELYCNANVQKIAPLAADSDCVVTLSNGSTIPADIVVVATDLTPRIQTAKDAHIDCKNGVLVNEFMQTSDPDIYAVGDMTEPWCAIQPTSQILPPGSTASYQGRLAADHILGRAAPYRGRIGVCSFKVLHQTAAIVGPSVELLREAGYFPRSVTVHVPDFPGYYPASQQMTLRLAFQADGGRILSAQIIGRLGVERRIDVLSTALQAGMSVFDLEALELSHMPQYGSSRDAVNVAGMVASNLLRGDLHLVSARELEDHLDEWQIIDVRPPESFAASHVPLARNIPIDNLREGLFGIDKRRFVVVYSRVGYHGYLAYRILKQSGYDVANLDGGLKLLMDGTRGGLSLSHGPE